MTTHTYTKSATAGRYTVHISPSTNYGYFECDGEAIGGLWFTGKRLTDQDGTYTTPKDVITAVRALGYVVPREFEF